MEIHVTNKTNKSWEVVHIIEKVRQLISKHRVRKIVSSVFLHLGRSVCYLGEEEL